MATAADGTEAKQTQDSLKQCLLSALSTGQAEPPTRPHARTHKDKNTASYILRYLAFLKHRRGGHKGVNAMMFGQE